MGKGSLNRGSTPLSVSRPDLIRMLDPIKNTHLPPLEKLGAGSHRIAIWTASCGHSFSDPIYSRVRASAECPYCSGQRVLAGFNDLAFLRPDLAVEWSDKNALGPHEVSTSSHRLATWICSEGHEWMTPVYSRAAKGNNCGICSNRKVIPGFNDLYARLDGVLEREWSSKNGLIFKDALSRSDDFIWEHPSCGATWRATIATRLAGFKKCPECYGSKSQLEAVVAQFLDSIGIRYLWNTKPLIRSGESNPRKRLQLDFILDDPKLAIEVQDFSTHQKSELPTEFTPLYYGGAPKHGPLYHEEKRALALEQLGIRLIDIWEDEIRDGSFKKVIQDLVGEKA